MQSAGMDEEGEAAEQTDEVLQQLLAFEAEQQQWLQGRLDVPDDDAEQLCEQQQQPQQHGGSEPPWQLHALRTPTSTELPEALPACQLLQQQHYASARVEEQAVCQLLGAAQQPVQHAA